MTDKQIIIDGVDVSGCCQYMPRHMEDYDIDTLDYCRYHFKPCKDVDVKYCYYKQLKRKEQALDEIGKLIPKFESSDACDYGDFDCENCSDLDEDTVCAYKLKKVIKGIINKAKGEINEKG